MVIGAKARRLLLRKAVKETQQAPEPPTESERLERKSTGKINRAYLYIFETVKKIPFPFFVHFLFYL
jgi:hypothetical protein